MEEIEEKEQVSQELEQLARERARQRAYDARWNLDIAIFAFAVLALVIILGFQKIRIEIVAPLAALGLGLVWLGGWKQGRKMYRQFYEEEYLTLKRESRENVHKPAEDSIEEMVQKAIRERYK